MAFAPLFPTPVRSRSVDGTKRNIPQTYFVAKRPRLAGLEYYFDSLGPSQSTLQLHRMLARRECELGRLARDQHAQLLAVDVNVVEIPRGEPS